MDLSPHPPPLDLRDTPPPPPPPPPSTMDLSPRPHHLHSLLDLRDIVVARGLVNSSFLQ